LCVLDFTHLEFTIGGDPSLPLRALVSVPNPGSVADDENSLDSSVGDDDIDLSVDYRKMFVEVILGPAILKLYTKSISRSKGAGTPMVKKWHIHPTDWARLTLEADKIAAETQLVGDFL